MNIEKFQELYSISLMETDEITKSILLVRSANNLSEADIDKLTPKRFNAMCKIVVREFEVLKKNWDNSKPRNMVKANGNWYYLNYELKKQPNNAGKYVEVATFQEDIIGNLHKIMATMSTPLRWGWKGLVPTTKDHAEIAEDMLKLDFETAYQSAVFFYLVFRESMQSLSTYFESELPMETREMFRNQWTDFINTLDGFTPPKWYQRWKLSL